MPTATITPQTFAKRVQASSQVASMAYHPQTKELWVIFKSAGPDRALYAYKDVPDVLWRRAQVAESVGSWHFHEIKKAGFAFDKRPLTEDEYQAAIAKVASDAAAAP